MITPQELRLGMYLRDTVRDKIIALEINHFKELAISAMNFFIRYQPIDLTEEWLLKLSFEKVNYTYWSKGLAVHNHDIVSFYMLYEQNRTYIKYVHQLQNLNFDLTREELTIKEQP